MKFIHTADWQLGAKMLKAGANAPEARASRLRAIERLLELARAEEVAFLVLSGDTFESPDIDDSVVRKTVELLDRFDPIPIYILPGNHDPFVPGGIWDRPSWRTVGEHVLLLLKPEEVEVGPGVCLFPCPLTQKRSPRDPTNWIPGREEGDERIRIGVAHGALDVLPGDTTNFPIRPDRAAVAGLDYLALGDWHGLMLASSSTAYPGTIEGTSYGEKEPGNVLVVEIEEAGVKPSIRSEKIGYLNWIQVEEEIGDETDVSALEEKLGQRENWDRLLIRLRVEVLPGCPTSAYAALQALIQDLQESSFHLDLDAVEGHTLDVQLPEGIVARADEILATILDGRIPEDHGRELSSEPPDVVSEARSLLHRLAAEVMQ